MWNPIANFKESIDKIALEVHGSDEELEINASGHDDSSASDRQNSHSLAQPKPASVSRSPVRKTVESPYVSEIEQYKAEIKRLQESEAEIKALSVNYAALLKEKEDQISRLHGENGSLKQSLHTSSNDSSKLLPRSPNVLKVNGELSFNRPHKFTTQAKHQSSGNQMRNGVIARQGGLGNGITHDVHSEDADSKMEKDLADMLEDKSKSLEAVQASYESQIKQLRGELDKEHNTSANLQLKLQDEINLNGPYQDELKLLKRSKDNATLEMEKINSELNEKIRHLQAKLQKREDDEAEDFVKSLKRVIAELERENMNLKTEKVELEAALNMRSLSTDKVSSNISENSVEHPRAISEKAFSLGSFPGKEDLEFMVQKLEKGLKEARQERDKALQELGRLKQHLLDKESEESEKMDEDSKIIEELCTNNEYLRAQILQLERALKQAIANQQEVKMTNNRELQLSKDIIDDLNQKLASSMNIIDAKNVELLNLQTALGQYYAEIEAKEHLERDFASAREESAKLSKFLKDAEQQLNISRREKEEILAKLSETERRLAEGDTRSNKLEEDNAKLRRALEQSMTRINRMSMDSDYYVDRRIVIKLLVTYFQRNHSKEVLGLMVRMLGFSDEDKQRIGIAQQGTGKGVVRGVLGLPGRLVGGILGGSPTESQASMTSENQSFADLWVDFLLKETEERERREARAANGEIKEDAVGKSQGATLASPTHIGRTVSGAVSFNSSPKQNHYMPSSFHGNALPSVHSESEFSTVPLSSSESNSQISRLFPKY